MQLQAVVLDADGTVLDTLSTVTYYVNESLRCEGYPEVDRDTVRKSVGNGAQLLIRRVLAAVGETDEGAFLRVYKRYDDAYNAAPLYLTNPFPFVCEAMRVWKDKGIKIGILSNKPHTATEPIVRHFFGEYITAVAGAKPGVPLKPDPTALLTMLTEMGTDAAHTLYVGDSGVDMTLGRAAEAQTTVGVLWGFRDDETELLATGAQKILTRPEDLLSLV